MSPISSRNSVPPLGFAKRPCAVADRAGEGAAHVAEQLALQELGRDRRAIDRRRRALRAAMPVLVDGARHELLAGPGLARDQHRRIAVGEHADGLLHGAHGLARPDQASSSAPTSERRARGSPRPASIRSQGARQSRGRSAWPDGRRRRAASPRSCSRAVAWAVSTATGGGVGRARMRRSTSRPSMPGMRRSSSTASIGVRVEQGDSARAGAAEPRVMTEVARGFAERLAHRRVVVDDQDGRHGIDDLEGCSGVDNSPRRAVAAMRVGDLAHDRQPEAGAIRPAGDERLEQLVADFRGRPGTLVANRKDEIVAIMPRGDEDGCPRGRGLDRVEDEIVERAAHLIRIERRLLVVRHAFERDRLRARELDVRRKSRIGETASGRRACGSVSLVRSRSRDGGAARRAARSVRGS